MQESLSDTITAQNKEALTSSSPLSENTFQLFIHSIHTHIPILKAQESFIASFAWSCINCYVYMKYSEDEIRKNIHKRVSYEKLWSTSMYADLYYTD